MRRRHPTPILRHAGIAATVAGAVLLGGAHAGQARTADPGGSDPHLQGTRWQLQEIVEPTRTWQPARGVVATLLLTEGRLDAKACNQYSGPATVKGDRVQVGDLAGTLMACPPPESEVEQAVTGLLAAGDLTWSVKDGRLTLQGLPGTDAEGHALVFTPAPA
jgi:heat shock protein HslJ